MTADRARNQVTTWRDKLTHHQKPFRELILLRSFVMFVSSFYWERIFCVLMGVFFGFLGSSQFFVINFDFPRKLFDFYFTRLLQESTSKQENFEYRFIYFLLMFPLYCFYFLLQKKVYDGEPIMFLMSPRDIFEWMLAAC